MSDLIDPSEINSVAGVLKLYLRELRSVHSFNNVSNGDVYFVIVALLS